MKTNAAIAWAAIPAGKLAISGVPSAVIHARGAAASMTERSFVNATPLVRSTGIVALTTPNFVMAWAIATETRRANVWSW